jgi:cysteine desulfurase family protein (TIGR01976 family)
MPCLDLKWIRDQFPALTQVVNNQPVIFLDGPGGTQTPQAVTEAMSHYLLTANANSHGAFATSERTDALVTSARSAVADLLGCDSNEIVFGANMTTLTFAVSRAIGRTLQPGDEIIVTVLDHYANVSTWQALSEQGVVIRTVDIHPEDCTLDLAHLEQLLNPKTRLVAVGYASNAVGTINDIARIVQLAHQVNALVYVDAVHYAPHGPMDVRQLDCDFLACSAYKFFGPHVGILYGKQKHLTQLQPYKVQPAPDEIPFCWETGTQNFEGIAGVLETIRYLTALGDQVAPTSQNRRAALLAGMNAIQAYEQELSRVLLTGLLEIPALKLYGITDDGWRTPTFGVRLAGHSPYDMAKYLAERGIFAWHGNFYALGVTERLGLESSGGLLRIGLVHYNTVYEVHQLLQTLQEMAKRN